MAEQSLSFLARQLGQGVAAGDIIVEDEAESGVEEVSWVSAIGTGEGYTGRQDHGSFIACCTPPLEFQNREVGSKWPRQVNKCSVRQSKTLWGLTSVGNMGPVRHGFDNRREIMKSIGWWGRGVAEDDLTTTRIMHLCEMQLPLFLWRQNSRHNLAMMWREA